MKWRQFRIPISCILYVIYIVHSATKLYGIYEGIQVHTFRWPQKLLHIIYFHLALLNVLRYVFFANLVYVSFELYGFYLQIRFMRYQVYTRIRITQNVGILFLVILKLKRNDYRKLNVLSVVNNFIKTDKFSDKKSYVFRASLGFNTYRYIIYFISHIIYSIHIIRNSNNRL